MGRLCQNVMRRNGVYWFTKKIRTPAGLRRVEFSLSVRQPELATMVAAQVSAQFHLLSHHVVSGQIDIKNFQQALAEVAANIAASRQNPIFDKLLDPLPPADMANGQADLEDMLKADVAAGRLLELIARHGEAMRDANFFIETLDENGFDDDEIRVCLGLVLPKIDEWLALRDGSLTDGRSSDAPDAGPAAISPFGRRLVMTTIGRTMVSPPRPPLNRIWSASTPSQTAQSPTSIASRLRHHGRNPTLSLVRPPRAAHRPARRPRRAPSNPSISIHSSLLSANISLLEKKTRRLDAIRRTCAQLGTSSPNS